MRVVANSQAVAVTAEVPKRFSSLIIELPVQQAGSGDPSPDNIRPIAQWTDVELYVADTDTATEPTLTTTLPTPIFGGMVDVARGEVASLYNEKKSSSGWEMVEAGQFRCQVGAFNNGDETSTNVADLYSSHYKTVSNKDAYDATDDLTCGTPTIEGVTYLYVNDLDYSTLEDFTAYIGDVQFVYKSHIPMSDEIAPTIVYLPEGESYVWATAGYEILTVTGTPPLALPNAAPRPVEQFEVAFTPVQDLHGYDSPWPAGGGVNKFDIDNLEQFYINNSENLSKGHKYTTAGTYSIHTYASDSVGVFIYARVKNSDDSWDSSIYIVADRTVYDNVFVTLTEGQELYVYDAISSHTEQESKAVFELWKVQVALSSTQPAQYYPYSNLCPITGWTGCEVYAEESYDPSATPKASVSFDHTVYGGTADVVGGIGSETYAEVDLGTLTWAYGESYGGYFNSNGINSIVADNYVCMSDRYKNAILNSTGITNNNYAICINANGSGGNITGAASNKAIIITNRDYNNGADFKAAMSGVKIYFPLATPTPFTFTPTTLSTSQGDNYAWSDTNGTTMTVSYWGKEQ